MCSEMFFLCFSLAGMSCSFNYVYYSTSKTSKAKRNLIIPMIGLNNLLLLFSLLQLVIPIIIYLLKIY